MLRAFLAVSSENFVTGILVSSMPQALWMATANSSADRMTIIRPRGFLSFWSDVFSDVAPVSVMSSIKLVLYLPTECFKFRLAMLGDVCDVAPSHDSFS